MATLDQTKDDFIEKIGLIAQGEGLPRIAGRVFGLLVFEGAPITFGTLAKQLQVSRGSVSSSMRLLQERGLVKRLAKPGERQEYFELAANPYVTLLEGARRNTRQARDDILESLEKLPKEEADVRKRLGAYADFYDAIDDGLANAVTRLNGTKGA
ncbi:MULTISPECIES: GbsR/MarR family transcriptional regulator [unclassified Marinovum]